MHRSTTIAAIVLALSLQLIGTSAAAPGDDQSGPSHDHSTHDHGPAQLPAVDVARGVVNRGLAVATDGPCLGLLEVVDVPGAVCTHGPDPAPPGIADVRTAELDADATLEEASTAAPFACDGDGVSGRRAHAIYAVTPDRTDRFAEYEAALKAVIAQVQDEYRQSSLLHGATDPAVFRFSHTKPVDGACEPLLDHVVLPSNADDDSFGATITALGELGYDDPSRRYLVFADANLLCGIAQMWSDDRSDPASNYNNREYEPLFSRVDAGCWGYVETHELTHNIGGVQNSAPNTSGAGHCNDEHDLMCYADGGSLSAIFVRDECSLKSLWERRLDCNGDDYFHPSPPAGSYLATHWNTWNSGWLFTEVAPVDDTSGDATDDSSGGDSSPTPPPPSNAPTVHISAPGEGATDRTFTFKGSWGDKDGDIEEVRLFVDDRRVARISVASAKTGGSWSKRITVSPGERVLSAQAVDKRGSTSKRGSVRVMALADMPSHDLFVDDDNSRFESAIERLAVQGVTRGCNPPSNTRFCPEDPVTRGQMAAFLTRALSLPSGSGIDFTDDDRSKFEDAIERLAAAGITRGCNPPSNTRFCPEDPVTRGQMAAFLTRALYS